MLLLSNLLITAAVIVLLVTLGWATTSRNYVWDKNGYVLVISALVILSLFGITATIKDNEYWVTKRANELAQMKKDLKETYPSLQFYDVNRGQQTAKFADGDRSCSTNLIEINKKWVVYKNPDKDKGWQVNCKPADLGYTEEELKQIAGK